MSKLTINTPDEVLELEVDPDEVNVEVDESGRLSILHGDSSVLAVFQPTAWNYFINEASDG